MGKEKGGEKKREGERVKGRKGKSEGEKEGKKEGEREKYARRKAFFSSGGRFFCEVHITDPAATRTMCCFYVLAFLNQVRKFISKKPVS